MHDIRRPRLLAPFLLFVAAILGGCAAESAPQEVCGEPRPEICTQQYDPVCGLKTDGSWKTYSNGCTACTDVAVEGWNPGECSS